MKAITKFLAGGVAIAALASAAPAAAQYYPGYGYPGSGYPGSGYPGYGYGMPGPTGGYGYSPYGTGVNSQAAVNQCSNVVQARLNGGYGNGYGYNSSGGGRVLGISRIEPRSTGGLTVRGVATSGRYGAYGYGQAQVDLVWRCRTDFRGYVVDIDIEPAQRNYGYNYTPRNYDYSQYGYQRY
jgi:hypothetical protein